MKKLTFLSMIIALCAFGMPAVARTCGSVTVSYEGSQDPDDDEFLYINMNEFKKAQEGYKNSGHKNSGSAKAYECDEINSGGCTHNETVTLAAGHVFKGKTVNVKTTYRCVAGLDDYWKPVSTGEVCKTQWGDLEVGKQIKQPKTPAECSGLAKTDETATEYVVRCRTGKQVVCVASKCREGYRVQNDKCVPDTKNCSGDYKDALVPCFKNQTGAKTCYRKCWNNGQGATTMILECQEGYVPDESTVNSGWKGPNGEKLYEKCMVKAKSGGGGGSVPAGGGSGSGGGSGKSCKDKRTTEIGKACCDVGPAVYDQKKDSCTCPDGQIFQIVQGVGTCGAGGTGGTPVINPIEAECNAAAATGAYYDATRNACLCRNEGTVWDATQKKCVELAGYADCRNSKDAKWDQTTGKCVCVSEDMEWNATTKKCEETDGARQKREKAQQDAARDKITSARNQIETLRSGLGTSVWKNKDGNFNTARLASDSIAGVVLGTVGGVVTSNVVKKNQLKSGFDDIKCTIGGQTVAEYGDEFQVGIR